MEDLPVDKLVRVYRKIRDAVQEKEDAHKAAIAELKEQMDMISTKLLEICNTQNVDSLRTKEGTITRRAATRYWTSDWGSMYAFLKEHDVNCPGKFFFVQLFQNNHAIRSLLNGQMECQGRHQTR